jgi:hypothetical protein
MRRRAGAFSDHLSARWSVISFVDVPEQRFSPTVVVGAITASATAGALVAIGHRMGYAGTAFVAITRAIARRSAPGGGAIVTGVVLHVVAVFVWSAVCVRLASRIGSKAVAALAVGAVNFAIASLVTWWTGGGLASELTLGDRLLYSVVLTASLIVGMRYAFLHPRETATS